MKKLFFPLFLAFFGSAAGQEIGFKVGTSTPARGIFTDRDFTLFTGIHLVPKLRMQAEIGARETFAFIADFSTFPASVKNVQAVNLVVGVGFFGEIGRVGRRNQINFGGGFQATRHSKMYAQLDWTRYRLGGSNAGFRLALTPVFSNFANANDFFGNGNSPEGLPRNLSYSLGGHFAVFHYILPKKTI